MENKYGGSSRKLKNRITISSKQSHSYRVISDRNYNSKDIAYILYVALFTIAKNN